MEAALALRARDDEARITLVSAEHDHFFSRPALMYVFAGQTSLRDTEPYDRGLYERMRFERVSRRVASLDAAGHALVFEDGSRLAYDRLLLAVGSKARPAPWPGAAGPGLHYFVTLRDLEALDREAKKGMRAAVLGGGLIGVEVAEVLHDRGPPRHLRDPRGLVLPGRPRPERGDPRGRAPASARRRRATGGERSTPSCAERTAGSARCASPGVARSRPTSWSSTIGVVPNTGFLADSGLTPRGERGDRDGRRAADVRPRRVGGGRLRERHVVRRLPPPGAALVHGPRPGPPRRPLDARRRGRLPPGHLVQLGQVLRPRVHDRRLRAGEHRPRRQPGRPSRGPADLVPAGARAVREPADRGRRATASWASTCSARAGTTSRSSTGSTSGARSTGC